MKTSSQKNILWWGRYDPGYSRNRILRQALEDLGFGLADFKPMSSALGSVQAIFHKFSKVDALWVPCFRQKDYRAAQRFADKHDLPIIFDPLISAWDKAVFERKKFPEKSGKSQRLFKWEKTLFSTADLVLADTNLHADFFVKTLKSKPVRTLVVPVGAEEQLFTSQHFNRAGQPAEVLFYGSFIHLQDPETIIEAAKLLPQVRFVLLGEGPLKQNCMAQAKGHANIHFEDWIDYTALPERIGKASILLGVFGSSPKAGRVIPNKAFQALSCGRALVTRESEAYPAQLKNTGNGIHFIQPGSGQALADKIQALLDANELAEQGAAARKVYEDNFSAAKIKQSLAIALQKINLL